MSATLDTKASFKVPSASVIFYGGLARFGELHARTGTAHQVLQRLFARVDGLKNAVLRHDFKIYRNEIIEGKELHEIALHLNLGEGETLHLVPVASGSKGKSASLGKTIAGAAIMVGALAAAPWSGGGSIFGALTTNAFSIGSFGVSYGAIAMFGAVTMLGGVSGLIGGAKKNHNDSSTTLSGTVNSSGQGGCIPEIYGRKVRVGSTVVSLAYSAQDWSNKNGDGNTDDNPSGEIDNLATGANHAEGSFSSLSGTGSKGKSGAGGSEKKNNLRSKAVVRVIDVIGHGSGIQPVTGLDENGAKSIFFNGTPLMNSDGTYNFYGVKWAWRSGAKNQEPVQGFPSAESTIQVNTKVPKAYPVTQELASETATSARVVISFPALYHTHTSTGVIDYGRDVQIQIEVKPNIDNGQWATVVTDTFSGKKCVSTYERAYVFSLPNALDTNAPTSWDVRVTRLSDDDTETGDASEFYFEYLDAITDHQMIYPDCAYCALQFDSSVFGDSLPDRSYDVTGKEIRVPANYDPVTRTYATTGDGTQAGTWDGVTWKIAQACDDPCWCMLDAMSSKSLMALPDSKLGTAEADLFIGSQYASQKVDDGFGGQECRYSLNVAITDRGDAYSVLQQFASVFRGMVYWANGGIAVSIDMPKKPTMIVTNGNVADGDFSYEGTALSGRHNQALVSYTNATNQTPFSDVESYSDPISIANIGLQQTTVDSFGCTSRGQALRLAHWTIDTELHQTQTVSYQCGLDHAGVRVGDIIEIADHWYQGARYGGRVRSGATSIAIPLDCDTTDNITLGGDITYQLKVIDENGEPQSATISKIETVVENGSQYSLVTLSTGLPFTPQANDVWVITDPNSNVLPQWMVVANADKGGNVYQITALYHDPKKYDRVENNAPFNEQIFSNIINSLPAPLTAPSGIGVQDCTVGSGTSTVIRTTVSWKDAADIKISGYRVRAVNSSGGITYYDAGYVNSYDIDGLDADSYTFGVQAYGKNGTVSAWVDGQSITINGNPVAPSAVTGLTAQGGTRKVWLTWSPSDTRYLLHYEIQRAPQKNGDVGDFALLAYVSATAYTDDDSQSLEPETTWYYRIRAVDTYGTEGAWSGIASAVTTVLLTDDIDQSIANTAKYAQSLLDGLTTPVVSDGIPSGSSDTYAASQVITNSKDGRLYQKQSDGTWKALIAMVSDTGQLTSDQIQDLEATKLVGQIVSDQIASVNADLVAGQLSDSQLAEISASKVAGQLTSSQIVSVTASQITEKLSADQIASIDAGQVQGQLTANQIASKTLTSDNIQSGSITSDVLQSGAIETRHLGAYVVTAGNIAGQSITSDKIVSQAITGDKIAANSITGDKIYAGSIDTSRLAAGAVTAEKLAIANADNLIINSCFDAYGAGLHGWSTEFKGTYATNWQITPCGTGFPENSEKWRLRDYGSLRIFKDWSTLSFKPGEGVFLYYNGENGSSAQTGIAKNANANRFYLRMQFVGSTPQDTSANIKISIGADFIAYDGSIVGTVSSAGQSLPQTGEWADMDGYYSILSSSFDIPSAALCVRPWICISNDGDTEYAGSVYVAVTKTQFCFLRDTDVSMPDWVPAGVTTIDGSGIKTGSLNADKIAANSITANQMASNSITSAAIQAGAIGTDQLAARAVKAENLAVEELIVDKAQIADLVVGTQHLADESVSHLYINDTPTTPTSSDWSTIFSVNTQDITSDEANVLCTFDCSAFARYGDNLGYNIMVQLLRGGNVVMSSNAISSSSSYDDTWLDFSKPLKAVQNENISVRIKIQSAYQTGYLKTATLSLMFMKK